KGTLFFRAKSDGNLRKFSRLTNQNLVAHARTRHLNPGHEKKCEKIEKKICASGNLCHTASTVEQTPLGASKTGSQARLDCVARPGKNGTERKGQGRLPS